MSIKMIYSTGPFSALTKYPDRGYDNWFDFGFLIFNQIDIGILKKVFSSSCLWFSLVSYRLKKNI